MWGGAIGLARACSVRLSRPAQTGGFGGVCFVGVEKHVATDLHSVQAGRMGQCGMGSHTVSWRGGG